jgi:hypothetical protein
MRMETRGQSVAVENVEQPSNAAKQAFETAASAFERGECRSATIALVHAFACTNASVATFQVLLCENNNISLCNQVANNYTEDRSVDRQVLLMAMAAADQEPPGSDERLLSLKNAAIGLTASTFILAVLQDRNLKHLGSTIPELRAITSWRVHHYRAIFFSRMYIMREAKRDMAKAYTLMKQAEDEDVELEGDYREYQQYRGENKYGCVLCGKVGGLFKCTRCEELSYCGEVCQRRHWEGGHRDYCDQLRRIVEETKEVDRVER